MSDVRPGRPSAPNEWLLLQPPMWVPWAWWGALLASIIASMAGNPAPLCTSAQPCQPDAAFPIAAALAGIATLAFWWEPVTALVAGVGYGALGVLFDPSIPGRYAEAMVAVMALGGLAVLRELRAKQAQVADQASELEVPSLAGALHSTGARIRGLGATYPLVGVAGLLLAVGSLACYHAATSLEQTHLDRAQPSLARVVTGTDDGDRQAFELQNGPRAGTRLLIPVADELAIGTERAVLLDPADPSWARLRSEPQGYTFWFGWATVGAVIAAWVALRLVAMARAGGQAPARQHRVRVAGDGRAELILARSRYPVAIVPVAQVGRMPRGGPEVPALIRGPLAHGGWVGIETRAGALQVTGPVCAIPRWRGLGVGASAGARTASGIHQSALSSWVSTHDDRLRTVGRTLAYGALAAVGCGLLWLGLHQAGPAWEAAQGRGVPGSFAITSVDCGGKGPCHHYGTFRSNDGQYSFTDVEVIGGSGDVGSSIPALYEGHGEGHGEAPDIVFTPGWRGLIESGFFVAVALGFLARPLRPLLAAISRRRNPPTGRHASGHP